MQDLPQHSSFVVFSTLKKIYSTLVHFGDSIPEENRSSGLEATFRLQESMRSLETQPFLGG